MYRYENKNGFGPYWSNSNKPKFTEMMWNHRYGTMHPDLDEDGLETYCNTNYFTACQSLEDLYRWFARYHELLYSSGYWIKEYETEEYVFGNSGLQLVFNKGKSELLSEIKQLTELEEFINI